MTWIGLWMLLSLFCFLLISGGLISRRELVDLACELAEIEAGFQRELRHLEATTPVVDLDALVTFEQVAKWLPEHVVHDIVTSAPCRDGGRHTWSYDETVTIRSSPTVMSTYRSWSCPGCGHTINRQPFHIEEDS